MTIGDICMTDVRYPACRRASSLHSHSPCDFLLSVSLPMLDLWSLFEFSSLKISSQKWPPLNHLMGKSTGRKLSSTTNLYSTVGFWDHKCGCQLILHHWQRNVSVLRGSPHLWLVLRIKPQDMLEVDFLTCPQKTKSLTRPNKNIQMCCIQASDIHKGWSYMSKQRVGVDRNVQEC